MHDVVSFFERDRPDREFDRPERDDGDTWRDESRWIDLHRRRLTTPVTRPSREAWQAAATKRAEASADELLRLQEVTRREGRRREAAELAAADGHRRRTTRRRAELSATAPASTPGPVMMPALGPSIAHEFRSRIQLSRAARFLDGGGGDIVLAAETPARMRFADVAWAITKFMRRDLIDGCRIALTIDGVETVTPLAQFNGQSLRLPRQTSDVVAVFACLRIDRATARAWLSGPPDEWGWVEIFVTRSSL